MKVSTEDASICFGGKCEKTIIFTRKEKGFSSTNYVKVSPPARHTFVASQGSVTGISTGIYTNGNEGIAVCFGYEKKGRKK